MKSKHIRKNTKNNYKNYKKSSKTVVFFVVFVLLIIVLVLKNNFQTKKYSNIQIILNNKNITSELSNDIITENEKIYMSFEDIKQFLDQSLYLEDLSQSIITTSPKKLAMLKLNDENITINGSTQKITNPILQKDNILYLAISELKNVYDYDFTYISSTQIVTIDSLNLKSQKAYTKKTINIKEENKLFSPTIEKVKKGSWLFYIDEENGISKVRTQNGNIGYVKTKNLYNFIVERENLIETTSTPLPENYFEYNISDKDISSFEKREEIINSILQETIKNDNMYVKILYSKESNFDFERFKIEIQPILKECGIIVEF